MGRRSLQQNANFFTCSRRFCCFSRTQKVQTYLLYYMEHFESLLNVSDNVSEENEIFIQIQFQCYTI